MERAPLRLINASIKLNIDNLQHTLEYVWLRFDYVFSSLYYKLFILIFRW